MFRKMLAVTLALYCITNNLQGADLSWHRRAINFFGKFVFPLRQKSFFKLWGVRWLPASEKNKVQKTQVYDATQISESWFKRYLADDNTLNTTVINTLNDKHLAVLREQARVTHYSEEMSDINRNAIEGMRQDRIFVQRLLWEVENTQIKREAKKLGIDTVKPGFIGSKEWWHLVCAPNSRS